MKALLLLMILVSFCSCGGSSGGGGGSPAITPGGNSTNEVESDYQKFLKLVNDHRASLGRGALTWSKVIEDEATGHSQNMGDGVVPFGHSGFSTRCSDIRSQIGGNGCGENVAMGQKDYQAVFNSWMNSPGHRANIENANYTHMGLGLYTNADGVNYWTQIFMDL